MYGLGGGVALRLSHQTPLLLSTFMKSQEVSVSQKKVGPVGDGVGEQVPMQSNICRNLSGWVGII